MFGSDETKIGDSEVAVSDKDLECFRKGEFSRSRWTEFSEGLVVILKEHVTTKDGEVSKREEKYSYLHYSMVDRYSRVDDAQEVSAEKQEPTVSKEADVAEENK